MIATDAKCAANGCKINNEIIPALNLLLKMTAVIGNVIQPQWQYSSDGGIQLVLPPAGATTNLEIEVVDDNNTPSTRWFIRTENQGI